MLRMQPSQLKCAETAKKLLPADVLLEEEASARDHDYSFIPINELRSNEAEVKLAFANYINDKRPYVPKITKSYVCKPLDADAPKFECANLCKAGTKCEYSPLYNLQWARTKTVVHEKKGAIKLADEDLARGSFVMPYTGQLFIKEDFDKVNDRRKEMRRMDDKPSWIYEMEASATVIVDPLERGCSSRLISHSCDPNLVLHKVIIVDGVELGFYADYDVKRGVELTFDYGPSYAGDKEEPEVCLCATPYCRGYITSDKRATELHEVRMSKKELRAWKKMRRQFHKKMTAHHAESIFVDPEYVPVKESRTERYNKRHPEKSENNCEAALPSTASDEPSTSSQQVPAQKRPLEEDDYKRTPAKQGRLDYSLYEEVDYSLFPSTHNNDDRESSSTPLSTSTSSSTRGSPALENASHGDAPSENCTSSLPKSRPSFRDVRDQPTIDALEDDEEQSTDVDLDLDQQDGPVQAKEDEDIDKLSESFAELAINDLLVREDLPAHDDLPVRTSHPHTTRGRKPVVPQHESDVAVPTTLPAHATEAKRLKSEIAKMRKQNYKGLKKSLSRCPSLTPGQVKNLEMMFKSMAANLEYSRQDITDPKAIRRRFTQKFLNDPKNEEAIKKFNEETTWLIHAQKSAADFAKNFVKAASARTLLIPMDNLDAGFSDFKEHMMLLHHDTRNWKILCDALPKGSARCRRR